MSKKKYVGYVMLIMIVILLCVIIRIYYNTNSMALDCVRLIFEPKCMCACLYVENSRIIQFIYEFLVYGTILYKLVLGIISIKLIVKLIKNKKRFYLYIIPIIDIIVSVLLFVIMIHDIFSNFM